MSKDIDLRAKAIRDTIELLKRQNWAYLTAPTGFGKTLIMLAIGEAFSGTKVMLTNSRNLVDQTKKVAEEKGAADWFFTTWQKAKNLTELGVTSVALVVIDEAHNGASGKGLSLKKALKNLRAQKVLYLTATPGPINQKEFGHRHGNEVEVPVRQAVAHDIILPIRMMAVTEERYFSAGEHEQHIADALEMTLEQLHSKLKEELPAEYQEDITAIRKLRRKMLLAVIVPAERQFVYYAENVQEIENTLSALKKLKVSAAAVYGANGKEQNRLAIEKFVREEIRVLVTCKMLREGWDHRPLEAVADAAFSPNTLHHTKQKAGRAARKFKMKVEGRYYYALGGHKRKRKSSILKLVNGTGDKIEDAAAIDGILLAGHRVVVEKELKANQLLLTYALDSIGSVEDSPAALAIRKNAKGLQALFNKASDKEYRPKKGTSPFNALRSLKQNAEKGRPSEAFKILKKLRPDWFEGKQSKVDRLIDVYFEGGRKALTSADQKYLRARTRNESPTREHIANRCPGLLEILDGSRADRAAKEKGLETFKEIHARLKGGGLLTSRDWKAIKRWRAKGISFYFKLRDDGLIK